MMIGRMARCAVSATLTWGATMTPVCANQSENLMSATAEGGASLSVAPGAASVRTEIFNLLKERRDAFYQGDIDKFGDFETDDFTRISEDGELVTKAQQLDYLRSRSKTQKTSERSIVYADDDLTLDVTGDVAVMTGRLTEMDSSKTGRRRTQRSRFTEIWVFREGHWRTLHNHYTHIAP